MKDTLTQRTINRLTQYHTILRDYKKKNIRFITSNQISSFLKIDETQVRKDLKLINCKGKCKVGYDVIELKDTIETVLDYKTVKRAFVIGAGNLGVALSKYSKFSEFGLDIVALFDTDEAKIGTQINSKPVYHLDKLSELIKQTGVNIAILTIPNKVAQSVCDKITSCGIKYIWNFAPTILSVKDGVEIWNENLIASFLKFCAISKIK